MINFQNIKSILSPKVEPLGYSVELGFVEGDKSLEVRGSSYGATLYADGQFSLWQAVTIPGVWRTANGDGYPDDVDINDIDLEGLPTDENIANRLFELVSEEDRLQRQENEEIDEMYRQMQEEDRLAEEHAESLERMRKESNAGRDDVFTGETYNDGC